MPKNLSVAFTVDITFASVAFAAAIVSIYRLWSNRSGKKDWQKLYLRGTIVSSLCLGCGDILHPRGTVQSTNWELNYVLYEATLATTKLLALYFFYSSFVAWENTINMQLSASTPTALVFYSAATMFILSDVVALVMGLVTGSSCSLAPQRFVMTFLAALLTPIVCWALLRLWFRATEQASASEPVRITEPCDRQSRINQTSRNSHCSAFPEKCQKHLNMNSQSQRRPIEPFPHVASLKMDRIAPRIVSSQSPSAIHHHPHNIPNPLQNEMIGTDLKLTGSYRKPSTRNASTLETADTSSRNMKSFDTLPASCVRLSQRSLEDGRTFKCSENGVRPTNDELSEGTSINNTGFFRGRQTLSTDVSRVINDPSSRTSKTFSIGNNNVPKAPSTRHHLPRWRSKRNAQLQLHALRRLSQRLMIAVVFWGIIGLATFVVGLHLSLDSLDCSESLRDIYYEVFEKEGGGRLHREFYAIGRIIIQCFYFFLLWYAGGPWRLSCVDQAAENAGALVDL